MTLPASGQIAFSQINTELGRSANAQISIESAENGDYATINPAACIPYNSGCPDSANPATISEWYGYYHDAKYSAGCQTMSTIYDCCGSDNGTLYSNCNFTGNAMAVGCYVYTTNGSGSPFANGVFYDFNGTGYIFTTDGSGYVTAQYGCFC